MSDEARAVREAHQAWQDAIEALPAICMEHLKAEEALASARKLLDEGCRRILDTHAAYDLAVARFNAAEATG